MPTWWLVDFQIEMETGMRWIYPGWLWIFLALWGLLNYVICQVCLSGYGLEFIQVYVLSKLYKRIVVDVVYLDFAKRLKVFRIVSHK